MAAPLGLGGLWKRGDLLRGMQRTYKVLHLLWKSFPHSIIF